MSEYQQLWDAGPVRITHSKRMDTDRRNAELQALRSRLVGDSGVKQDPLTGQWYEIHGKQRVRRAWPRTCQQCGARYMQSHKRERTQSKGRCEKCRRARLPDGSTRQDVDGYTWIKVGGQWVSEHRHVMAQYIGRAVGDGETVHHIDGNRSNNRVDNLQLRQGQHGAGQTWCCVDCGSFNIAAVPLGE